MDEEMKKLLNSPLVDLLKEMGWDIAIPKGGGPEDDGNIHGFIIGEQSYIDYILKHLD